VYECAYLHFYILLLCVFLAGTNDDVVVGVGVECSRDVLFATDSFEWLGGKLSFPHLRAHLAGIKG